MRLINTKIERRKEKRQHCHWPIWFADGRDDKLFYGDVVDYAADSLSIICKNSTVLLEPGCVVKIYFGYSHTTLKKSHGVGMFSCEGNIYRVDTLGRFLCRKTRIAIKLDKRLPFATSRIKTLKVIFEILQRPDAKKQLVLCLVGPDAEAD